MLIHSILLWSIFFCCHAPCHVRPLFALLHMQSVSCNLHAYPCADPTVHPTNLLVCNWCSSGNPRQPFTQAETGFQRQQKHRNM